LRTVLTQTALVTHGQIRTSGVSCEWLCKLLLRT
jgi:hypothetical protein